MKIIFFYVCNCCNVCDAVFINTTTTLRSRDTFVLLKTKDLNCLAVVWYLPRFKQMRSPLVGTLVKFSTKCSCTVAQKICKFIAQQRLLVYSLVYRLQTRTIVRTFLLRYQQNGLRSSSIQLLGEPRISHLLVPSMLLCELLVCVSWTLWSPIPTHRYYKRNGCFTPSTRFLSDFGY